MARPWRVQAASEKQENLRLQELFALPIGSYIQ